MQQEDIKTDIRPVIAASLKKAEETSAPATAIQMADGTIITGKTSPLLGASAALLLNALKYIAGLPDDMLLIDPSVIEPIQNLKVNHLGNRNPRLHLDEVLIALSICAAENPKAKAAMDSIGALRHLEAHSTVILSAVDLNVFRKIGVNITCEPKYQSKSLYHR